MKKICLSVILLTVLNLCFAQKGLTIYEPGSRFTNKTDLSLIDTLERWEYIVDTLFKPRREGTNVKPIATIIFRRNKALYDKKSRETYGRDWMPSMHFEIYNIADSAYCLKESKITAMLSSCVVPDVGSDIFVIGNYIFLNPSVCINCAKYDNGVDFCRPLINFVFSKVNPQQTHTLEEIVGQLPIKRVNLKE